MQGSEATLYDEKTLQAMMEEKTYLLTKARALVDLGQAEEARPLWPEVAAREERIAPLLDLLDRGREAAMHRISAGSCYEKAGEFSQAVNLYRAALSSPLPDHTRRDVEEMLDRCLARLAATPVPSVLRPERRVAAVAA